ncbi:hypothetical protein LTR36_007101 [Oleoguttula mirabilis]|uniref:Uncharacterized protein n=1 Tax=Oleoguttula mirabilis TaxID=1507867 RepID=A0AAV9JAZ3_9PEZI|nr:hypothetical protein LTR36_007101 [Oleoguttula mirabilis]
MDWPSEYEENFSRAFPKGTPYSTGFELRNSGLPLPHLDIVLVTGDTTTATQSMCERFAQEFRFRHIHIREYLRSLADQGEDAGRALGSLHPLALKGILHSKKDVPAFFLLQILRYMIDEEVKRGQTRFMISGLDEDAETAMVFAEKIAEPAALFSFMYPATKGSEDASAHAAQISDVRASIEEDYEDILLEVEVADQEVEGAYERLFAAISERACSVPEMVMEDEQMGYARADSIVQT